MANLLRYKILMYLCYTGGMCLGKSRNYWADLYILKNSSISSRGTYTFYTDPCSSFLFCLYLLLFVIFSLRLFIYQIRVLYIYIYKKRFLNKVKWVNELTSFSRMTIQMSLETGFPRCRDNTAKDFKIWIDSSVSNGPEGLLKHLERHLS